VAEREDKPPCPSLPIDGVVIPVRPDARSNAVTFDWLSSTFCFNAASCPVSQEDVLDDA
jgi:hypothetical protein